MHQKEELEAWEPDRPPENQMEWEDNAKIVTTNKKSKASFSAASMKNILTSILVCHLYASVVE